MSDKEGFMSADQAERAIWSYYWQLDNSRDRRSSPIMLEPPDEISEEEVERLRERQTPLMRKAMLKGVSLLQRRGGRVGGVLAKIGRRIWTEKSEREYFDQAVAEAAEEMVENQGSPGQLDPRTGLPMSEADLQGGRGIVSGVDLCMEAIVPPRDLAEASTTWLPPCPSDEPAEKWGSQMDHWQALAFKPKLLHCKKCGGTGAVNQAVHNTRFGRGFAVHDGKSMRQVRCGNCGGNGSKEFWAEEEHAAIKHNTVMIGRRVAVLAKDGYFDLRPIDDNDVEMGDLVWTDKAGLTLGYRLTWEGYERMKEFCAEDPELQQATHVLALAGRDVRSTAPKWARDEYKNSKPIEVTTGGFDVTTSADLDL